MVYYPPAVVYAPAVPAQRTPLELTPYRSAKGKTYRVFDTFEAQTAEHDRPRPSLTGAGADPDAFLGQARKVAKTSISAGPMKAYADVGALLDDLVDDQTMKEKELEDQPRTAEEEKNVTMTAFIYAVKKEADNDYHVILGTEPGGDETRFMTAEVSGLPEAGPFKAPLKKVRDKFKNNPALAQVRSSYIKFNPPIPVRVKGSLFFDVDHFPPGSIGPAGFRPKTAWEIHPVTDLEFEP